MSVQSSNGNFSVLQFSSEGDLVKEDVLFSNGVKLYSINFVTKAGSKTDIPDKSLYVDKNGAFGVVDKGILKPFLLA